MAEITIEFDNVWKKFKKGERYDSLRDFIPAMAKLFFSRNYREELEEKEFWALRDISFAVHQGEVLGIIGPNGAGKSTILKTISGILRPTKGKVRVRGRISSLIEVGAGFHPDLTGRENIYLNGSILGMTRKEIDRRLDEIIDFSGIGDFIDTPIKRYSSGMYTRLGFSVAAYMSPDVLLVDEILSVGDALFRTKCIQRMSELINSGATVLFISHNMELVRQLCSTCIVLSNGGIDFLGSTDKAINKYMKILQSGGISGQVSEPLRHDIGKILGLSFIDKNGRFVNQVDCGGSVSLLINYEIYKPVGELAFAVNFSLPTGLWVVHCNTIHDRFAIEGIPGFHQVKLNIKNLNLSPSDYLLSVRLLCQAAPKGYTIDLHPFRYTLIVNGEVQTGSLVMLDHEWGPI